MKIKAKDGKLYAEVTLRDVVENCDVSDLPMLAEIKRLYAENDELRELVRDMDTCISNGAGIDCSRCPFSGKDECYFDFRMRRLGIEVDE